MGSKCDLEEHREVSVDEGKELARKFKCPFFETSAKARLNVEESFSEVVRQIKKRRQQNNPTPAPVKDRRSCVLF